MQVVIDSSAKFVDSTSIFSSVNPNICFEISTFKFFISPRVFFRAASKFSNIIGRIPFGDLRNLYLRCPQRICFGLLLRFFSS